MGTIRVQMLLAFLAMAIITASLGFFSVRDLEREGELVDRTFDRSLMSINYARAAAADFNALQATVARRVLAADGPARAALDKTAADLEAGMDDDLSIAVERSQSDRVVLAAANVARAASAWKETRATLGGSKDTAAVWAALDHQATVVAQQLDLLVNYAAGDAFTYRQKAHATVLSDKRLNIFATFAAVLISATIAWLLSRRIISPIRKASEVATRIADGDLGVSVPVGKSDELGALLAAMEMMRGRIKTSMEREVDLRQSAQMRLADALEGSCEGIVVIDADARIALANAQASHLLAPICPPLQNGAAAATLLTSLRGFGDVDDTPCEVEVAEGCWLRIGRSGTQDGGTLYVFSDISLFKSQQAALKTANLWLDAAIDNLVQGLCLFDSSNQLRVFNARFCELFQIAPDRVHAGMSLGQLVEVGFGRALKDVPAAVYRAQLEQRVAARQPVQEMMELADGRSLAVSLRPLDEKSWLATYEDVTDRLEAAEKIAYMARHDTLTGLPNRAFFAERIHAALTAVDRGEHFALICLDLDHFKEVNDTLGHPIGDELLRTVASRLSAAIRETDMVARLGGDEFAIIQTGVENAEDVRVLAERILACLNEPCVIEGNPLPIGVSIGISMAPHDGRAYDKLLKNADMALYRVKADGRNGYCFFERSMDDRQQARRLVELDLREALARGQFELDYQPVCDVAGDRIGSFEALIRWRHPTRGIVPPSDFISIAEEMGFVTEIGSWVLTHACRDAMDWPEDVAVAVNVSAAQLRHASLYDSVVVALARSGLAPRRLVLEITETVLMANAQHALLVLNRFKAMGIRIAMDDFGTGYSSLSYLRSFPFDLVKIDKSFMHEVTTKPEAASIVRAVVSLCSSLGIRVVAEGIETEAQLAFLKAEGCHEAQGFFFSRPIPAAAVPALLETQVNLAKFFSTKAA